MKPRLRKLWLKIHRWIGLTIGLLFVLLGLTGSVLVFDHAIDEWLYPELLLTEGSGERAPLAKVIAAAEEAYSGAPAPAAAVTAPRVERGVWLVWFQGGTEEAPTFTHVCVDPYSAEVTGERTWGEYPMAIVYKLHYQLLGGDAGETVVGVAGSVLMISVVSGLYLWWPLWRNGWRAAFAVRRGARFNYDLHKTIGVASSLVLLAIAFTGVYMIFPEWVKPVVTTFSAETKPPEVQSDASSETSGISPDRALAIARRHFPDAEFDHLHPAHGPEGAYEVAFRQAGEVQKSFGRTQVWIDRYDGGILAVRTPDDFSAADTFVAWQFPLHNGEAFGLIGRWIVFFTGFAPAVLYVTGFLLWRRKRRSRRQQSRNVRRDAAPAVKRADLSRSPEIPHGRPREPLVARISAKPSK